MTLPRPPLARITIPRRLPDLLRRELLLSFLHENVYRKLVLVSAAAGYGKSSLVIDFAHETDLPVAWLRFDETDRDLAVLAGDLAAALHQRFAAFDSNLPQLAAQPGAQPADLGTAFAREIEGGLDAYFVFALDDYHVLDGVEPVSRFFDALLAALPEQAHLFITGRTIPSLSLATLTARNQVAGLSEENLRFSSEEVRALLEMRNHVTLPEAEAGELVSRTEGWITGILLTSQLMWRGLVSNLMRSDQGEGQLYEYLAAEVLSQQPEPLRQFLIESSVLPEMEPAVCDVVLERSDSAAMLQQVETRRLFVTTVGDDFRAYQYHNLFRDFLLSRLRTQAPERLKALQARAADWFASRGMLEAAVTFYLVARQTRRAGEIAEANAEPLYQAGRLATIRRWGEQLAAIAPETPYLRMYLGKMASDASQPEQAHTEFDSAATTFAQTNETRGSLRVDLNRAWLFMRSGAYSQALRLANDCLPRARALNRPILASIALRVIAGCESAEGDLAQAGNSLLEAISLLGAPEDWYDKAGALDALANNLRRRGKVAEASQTQLASLKVWREHNVPDMLATALNNVGTDLYMLGQYQAALATYDEALDYARQVGRSRLDALLLLSKAEVYADLDDYAKAAGLLSQSLVYVEQTSDNRLRAVVYYLWASLEHHAGSFVSALEWLRRADLSLSESKDRQFQAQVNALRGMILVEMGHTNDGRQVLELACAELEKMGSLSELAQSLLYFAFCEFRIGAESAFALTARAFMLSEQIGSDQMLLREAQCVKELLAACLNRTELASRAAALLARMGTRQAGRENVEPRPAIAAGLRVQALGQHRVVRDGIEIQRTAWETQRTRELFFFLVDRTPIARHVALEAFWPGKTAARGAANLYQTLYRLRRVLGYEIASLAEQECRLAPDLKLDYDVVEFERAARTALALDHHELRRLAALQEAAELYTGDYLADLPVDWAFERRRALSELHIHVLGQYADALMTLTRYAEAHQVLARALASEPLHDDLHQRMLVCLAGLGHRHEVVDHYRRYRETLRTELGIDPPSDIQSLYSRLIN